MTTWQAVENMGGAPGILEGALGSEPAVVNTNQNIGKLYVVSSGGAAKILRQGTTTWVKVAITDWADLDGKPSTFAPDLTAHLAAADPHTQYQRESEKGAASGYAPLDASSLIPTAHIPALAISEVDVVASQAAMLALSAELGDIAIRTDFDPDRSYMLTGSDPTVLANWTRVTFGDVVSVNGQTGAIVLAATDVGAAPSSHVGAGGAAHSNAVAAGAAGFMTGTDKTKLDGIEANAKDNPSSAEIIGAFTGTPDGTKFLRDDGTLAAGGGGGGLAAATQPETDAGTLDTVALTPLKDASKARVKRKFSTGSSALAAEGEQRYDSTRKLMSWHDGVRERADTTIGYMPFAYPIGGGPALVTSTAAGVVANGGTLAVPVTLDGHMLLQSVSYWDTSASGARGPIEFALFEDRLNNANTLDLVAEAAGTLAAYTPSAASLRTIAVTNPPVYLAPGCYWLAMKNNHATAVFNLGLSAIGTMAVGAAQTKTLTTAAFGSTLDFVAATWTKINNVPGVRLNGRVFGQTAAF